MDLGPELDFTHHLTPSDQHNSTNSTGYIYLYNKVEMAHTLEALHDSVLLEWTIFNAIHDTHHLALNSIKAQTALRIYIYQRSKQHRF